MEMKEYKLSKKDAAAKLGCSSRHIERLINSGKLKAINIATGEHHKAWRISQEDLLEYVRQVAR